jgi:hypothetical protein
MSPEKAAKLAANCLMLAFKNIVPDNCAGASGHFRRGPSEQVFLLKPECLEALSSAARKLVPLIDFYPLEKCTDLLANYVVAEKDAGTPLYQVHERLRQKVLQFLQSFISQGEWEVVYAVRGVNCSEGSLALGQCRFYLMDDHQFALWGRRFATGRYDPPNDAPLFQSWVQHDGVLRGQIVGVARVRATDQDHAGAKGRSRIEEVINLIRYGQMAIGIGFATFPEVGLRNQCELDNHSIVIRLDNPSCATNMSGGGGAGVALSILRHAPGWHECENVIRLDMSARNELQLRLTTALQWIGQAALAPSGSIRLVALVTALEALLIEESESVGKKSKLARRISKLVADSEAGAQGLATEVEELYKTRSECIHAGLVDVEKAEIDRAVRFVTKTVEALLTRPPYSSANALEDILPLIDPSLAQPDAVRSRWVAENAYFRWRNEGCPHDRNCQHWLDAEREFICTTILRGRPLDSFGAEREAVQTDVVDRVIGYLKELE